MPLVEPGGRRFTLSPAIIVAGLVVLVIALFIGYLGVQFLRFVDVTPVALTYPANVVPTIDASEITLQGTAGRGAIISITGPDGTPYSTTADQNGNWSRDRAARAWRNNFQIIATDPVTATRLDARPAADQRAAAERLAGRAARRPAPPAPITMQLFTPTTGTTTSDPNVTVSGATTGTRVTIGSTYAGAPPATPPPSGLPVTAVAPAQLLARRRRAHRPSGQPQT